MQKKKENFRPLRSVMTFALAATIVTGSVYTVAAAANFDADAKQTVTTEGVELANGDIIYAGLGETGFTSSMLKAVEIKIDYNGERRSVSLAKGTVVDVLERTGITPAYDEVVEPALSTPIAENLTVKIYKGKKLSITADGKTDSVYVPNGNVCDVLAELGYKHSDDDILNVDRNSNIEDADKIVIKRVTYKNETETQSVNFETVKKNSKDVELGKTKVQTEGKKGEALVTKMCKYIDGKKVSSETVDTKITKEPVDKVVLMGTKGSNVSNPAGTFTDNNGNTVAYSSVVTGSGTAYTAPAGSLTATGVTAYHGGVAVNPNIIPYGSKLYIVSTDGSFVYGYATAVDTGGALMAGTAIVDCFYNTYDECVNFGRRNVNVYIVG
nr:3D domain-containing protein [uncultured Ruminococcus sp.]